MSACLGLGFVSRLQAILSLALCIHGMKVVYRIARQFADTQGANGQLWICPRMPGSNFFWMLQIPLALKPASTLGQLLGGLCTAVTMAGVCLRRCTPYFDKLQTTNPCHALACLGSNFCGCCNSISTICDNFCGGLCPDSLHAAAYLLAEPLYSTHLPACGTPSFSGTSHAQPYVPQCAAEAQLACHNLARV
jgi:hypothetical protein